METAEIARKALAILDEHGWCKFALTDMAGRHCLGGAWNLAHHGYCDWNVGNPRWYYEQPLVIDESAHQPLADAICALYPEFSSLLSMSRLREIAITRGEVTPAAWLIADWNNHPDTTEDDVRAVLEKLAAG